MKRILTQRELPEGEYRVFEMQQLWVVTCEGVPVSWGIRRPSQIQEVKTLSQPRAFASQVAADRQARLLNDRFQTDHFRIEQILTRKV
jgi:hypothetical protein